MNELYVGLIAASLTFGACVIDETDTDGIDQQQLADYRKALPTRAQLEAPRVQPSTMTALGDPAFYPTVSYDVVAGINGAVSGTIAILELLVDTPPTFYNSETKEFVWGPWPEDVGYSAAYLKDAGPGEDFRYHFAFLRGAGNDLATLTPVVWGGANPDADNEDYGTGITMWDFDAARDFDAANNPAHDPSQFDSGRFVALFGKGIADDDPDAELTFVVSVFRNFVPKDDSVAEPVNLDYLYGRYQNATDTIDFIDYEANVDVSDPADGVAEDIGVRMAFLNEGTGKAEADAANGSLASGSTFHVTECWNTSLDETYLQGEERAGGEVMNSWQNGVASDCGLFEADLDDLQIPSLDDIDPNLMAALDAIATNGAN